MREKKKTAPKRLKTSPLWKLFTPIEGYKAKCDICKVKLSCKSTISNLRKHLERKHPFIKLADFVAVTKSLKKVREKLKNAEAESVLNDLSGEAEVAELGLDEQELDVQTSPEIDTEEFIRAYKLHPALWDLDCTLYNDPVKQSEAYEHIAEKFNVTSEVVKWKINELNLQFQKELKMIGKQSSTKITEPFKTKWPHFESLLFLSNLTDEETGKGSVEEVVSEDLNVIGNLKFKEMRSSVMEGDKNILESSKGSVSDHYDIFGSFVTSTLRDISTPHLKRKLERRIQQVILEIREEEENILAAVNTTSSGTIRVIPPENLFSYVGFIPQ